MMGLLKKERLLSSFWTKETTGHDLPDDIISIQAEAKALSLETGIIFLGYEFSNYAQHVKEKKDREKNSL
jgi:hypothetical protein